MKDYNLGQDANRFEILVRRVDIEPYCRIIRGNMINGVVLKFGMYDLEDVLCQMIEDYGAEELIKRIKELNE